MAATKTKTTSSSTSTKTGKTGSSTRAGKFPTFTSLDFSKFDVSKVDLPKVDPEAITNAAKDVAYIGIGVAVLAFQRAQTVRRDVTKSLNDQYSNNKAQIDDLVGTLDTRLVSVESKWNSAIEDLEKRLPSPAGTILGQAHDAAKSARQQLRVKLVPNAA